MGFLKMNNEVLLRILLDDALYNIILYSLCGMKKAPAMTNAEFQFIDLRAGFKLI